MASIVNIVTDTDTHKLWHVKLDKSKIARKMTTDGARGGYVEVDHVLVGVSDIEKEDSRGKFFYRETVVIGTDEKGESSPIFLYLTQRVLTLDEVLWMIGETVDR